MSKAYAGLLFTFVLGAAGSVASPITVGGFDAARGGIGALSTNAGLQSLILSEFPGSTFSSTATLTSAYLSTISDLVISVGFTNSSGITPLSAAEQTALFNFVLGGGTALLFTDNDSFNASAPAVNSSFLTPFGLTATGTLSGFQSSTLSTALIPWLLVRREPQPDLTQIFPVGSPRSEMLPNLRN